MFAIRLVDTGPNRLRVISLASRLLRLGRADAKRLVDSAGDRLATGDARRIAYLRRQFQEAGAVVDVAYAPDAMMPETWVRENLSLDKKSCRKCGAALFFAIPGLTTEEEIIAFVRGCRIPSAGQIAADRWIHPGVYCPNGCGFVMVDFEHPDQYTGLVE